WDVATGQRYAQVEQQARLNWDPLALSPDGRTLAVVDHGNNVCLHEVPAGRRLHKLPYAGVAPYGADYPPAFAPDGRTLAASGPESLFVWDVATGRLRHEIQDCRGPVAFSPDGQHLACGTRERIRLFEAATFKEVRAFEAYEDEVFSLAFSA